MVGKINGIFMAVVWEISVVHLDEIVLLSGVILKDKPITYNKKIGSFRNLLKVTKSYFIDVCNHTKIVIFIDGKIINTETDDHGSFSVLLDFIPKGELIIRLTEGGQDLEILQTYPVVFQNTVSPFDVISDIDDTIIYSYTASFFKRIGTVTFMSPYARKPIKYIQNLLDTFQKQDTRIFYVSKSESNLFGMLTTFIAHNKLPKGHLILTPYLNYKQLFKSKKDNFKLKNIRFIIENSGNKKFVLFGDDSQKDMEIYTNIVMEFPKRILKVYIRQTKNNILPNQNTMWKKLRATGAEVNYFKADNEMDVVKEFEQLKNSMI